MVNKGLRFVFRAILLLIFASLIACTSNDSIEKTNSSNKELVQSEEAEIQLKELSAQKLNLLLATDANSIVVLDIRYRDDYHLKHIDGSINIVFSEVVDRLDELPKNKEIAVVCYKGQTAKGVAKDLQTAGFNATVVTGGFEAIDVLEGFQLIINSAEENEK